MIVCAVFVKTTVAWHCSAWHDENEQKAMRPDIFRGTLSESHSRYKRYICFLGVNSFYSLAQFSHVSWISHLMRRDCVSEKNKGREREECQHPELLCAALAASAGCTGVSLINCTKGEKGKEKQSELSRIALAASLPCSLMQSLNK